MARLPFEQLVAEIAEDIHPPLYFVLLSWWLPVAGSGEFALRFFTVLTGLPTVPLLHALGRRIGGPRVGLAAGLVAALSPLLVYYSHEVRMYAGSVTLVTAAAFFGWRAIEGERPRRWLVPYVLLGVAAGYTHLYNLLVVLVMNVAYLFLVLPPLLRAAPARKGGATIFARLRPVAWWAAAQVAVVAGMLPWLPVLRRKELVGVGVIWRPFEDLGPALANLGQSFALGVFPVPGPYSGLAWLVWLAAAAGALALAASLARRRWDGPSTAAVPGSIWLLLCFAFIYVSLAGRREVAARYLLVAYPGFALLAGAGLAWALRAPWAYWAGLAAVVVASAFPLADYYRDPILPRPDDRAAVRAFENSAGPGDVGIFNAHYQSMVYEYYGRRGLPIAHVPAPAYAGRHADESGMRAATEKTLAELAGKYERLWVFFWQDYFTDPDQVVEKWLDNNLVRFRQEVFNGWIRLKGYERRPLGEITFGNAIRLAAYEITPWPLQAGEPATVKLTWQVVGTPARDYQVFVHVVDKDYRFAAQHDGPPEGGKSLTSTWRPGMRIVDVHDLKIAPEAAGGEYFVRVGYYSLDDMKRLPTATSDHLVVTKWPLAGPKR